MNPTRLREAISNLMDATRAECRDGPHAPVEEAQEAVEAALSALSAASAVRSEPVACERCQGNGEIVTDWDRYTKAKPGDKGDEAVAECPDCNGTGYTSPVQTREDGIREAAKIAAERWRELDAQLAGGKILEHLQERVTGRAFEAQALEASILALLSPPEPKGE